MSIKAIVKDVQDAERSYGPYVKAGTADVSNGSSLVRALKGVRALVCLGKTGALLPAAKQAGVEHVVLLSMAGECGMLLACMHGALRCRCFT